MKIKKVELTNVKCYSNAEFDFENGINFISGKNGAGKTSIIESIGYALFNYKIGKSGFADYFIKRGEKKAIIKVIFEDKDREEYIVERKLGFNSASNSWIVKDIVDEEEIVSGEIDVVNWLKDHLGFYKDDNISEIYENIISVPQGMFTSAFLDTAVNRKNKFDPIFNLEIYRTVFKNTASLESGLKSKKITNEMELGKLQVKIERLKLDEQEYKNLKKEVDTIVQQRKEKEKEYSELDKIYQEKNNIKKEISKVEESIKINTINQENINKNIEIFQKDLKVSQEANLILEKNKSGYDTYIQEEKKQVELKKDKKQFDILTENIKTFKMNIEGSKQIITLKQENKNEIEATVKSMIEEIKKQEKVNKDEEQKLKEYLLKLEQERIDLNELLQSDAKLDESKVIIDHNKIMIKGILENKLKLNNQNSKEKELLEEKKELEEQIKNREKIEKEKEEIEEKLSTLSAKLEQLKESKKIAKDGICPFLKSECINVKGKSQEEYQLEIEEVKSQIDVIKKEKTKIEKQEKDLIKAEANIKMLVVKLNEIEERKKEIKDFEQQIKEKEEELKKAENTIFKILEQNGIEKDLDNIKVFKKFIKERQDAFNKKDKEYNVSKTNLENIIKEHEKRKSELEKNNKSIEKLVKEIQEENEKIAKYNEKINLVNEDLKAYANIEKMIEQNEKALEETKIAYNTYIQNLEIAKKASEIEKSLAEAGEKVKSINDVLKESNKQLEILKGNYNEEEFKKLEQNRMNLNNVLTELKVKIDTMKNRIADLKEHVNELKEAKVSIKEFEKQIVSYQKAIDYLTKIRQIIKQAPEDISEILIQKVSQRATEIYSRIASDSTTLQWREGYEVILIDSIEGKRIEKEFKQLSGGEQMSAALAIRISMLEILTNLGVGILDEPTVNMDVYRRQRLAEIIESITTSFEQLFVVSHDDTFNSITENMIQLG